MSSMEVLNRIRAAEARAEEIGKEAQRKPEDFKQSSGRGRELAIISPETIEQKQADG